MALEHCTCKLCVKRLNAGFRPTNEDGLPWITFYFSLGADSVFFLGETLLVVDDTATLFSHFVDEALNDQNFLEILEMMSGQIPHAKHSKCVYGLVTSSDKEGLKEELESFFLELEASGYLLVSHNHQNGTSIPVILESSKL